jgi:thioredoxin-related protein
MTAALPRRWTLVAAIFASLTIASGVRAQVVAPYAIDIPPWFVESFLDFREDVADAAKDGRRLMIYFGQDGCPYCRQLMVTSFSQRGIVDKTRRNFVAIALNIWGDRETTWIDGRTRTEKALARALDVQFTPTLLFLDEKGKIVARVNGYWSPHRLEAVLDYVAGKREGQETLAAYLARTPREPGSATLADEPFFIAPPYDLGRKTGGKPLAVLFETPDCSACDELHRDVLRRPDVQAQVARFDVARFGLGMRTELTTPRGDRIRADAWARDLRVIYTPTFVFFDTDGGEVFRIDAYMRAFHVASALDYVASGAYRVEPSFQRFVQARADRLRAVGTSVDLWD